MAALSIKASMPYVESLHANGPMYLLTESGIDTTESALLRRLVERIPLHDSRFDVLRWTVHLLFRDDYYSKMENSIEHLIQRLRISLSRIFDAQDTDDYGVPFCTLSLESRDILSLHNICHYIALVYSSSNVSGNGLNAYSIPDLVSGIKACISHYSMWDYAMRVWSAMFGGNVWCVAFESFCNQIMRFVRYGIESLHFDDQNSLGDELQNKRDADGCVVTQLTSEIQSLALASAANARTNVALVSACCSTLKPILKKQLDFLHTDSVSLFAWIDWIKNSNDNVFDALFVTLDCWTSKAFHGHIGYRESLMSLQPLVPGSYLIRYSCSNSGSIVLAIVTDKFEVVQTQIHRDWNAGGALTVGSKRYASLNQTLKSLTSLKYGVPRDLTCSRWFHGMLSFDETEELLRKASRKNCCIVRYSQSQPGKLVIGFIQAPGNPVKQCIVTRNRRMSKLGTTSDEEQIANFEFDLSGRKFSSIGDVLLCHSNQLGWLISSSYRAELCSTELAVNADRKDDIAIFELARQFRHYCATNSSADMSNERLYVSPKSPKHHPSAKSRYSSPSSVFDLRPCNRSTCREEPSVISKSDEMLASEIPSFLRCPITMELFRDPVVASDGYTYERSSIEEWLKRNWRSPSTNLPLESDRVVPNYAIRSQVLEWLAKHNKS